MAAAGSKIRVIPNKKTVNLTLSANHPVHPCAPSKSSAHAYTQNCARICTQQRKLLLTFLTNDSDTQRHKILPNQR